MGGFGSYFNNQYQQSQQGLPANMQPQEQPPASPQGSNPYRVEGTNNTYNPYQQYGGRVMGPPGQPIPNQQQPGMMYAGGSPGYYNGPNSPGQGGGMNRGAWPGQGYGGLPGRYGGGMGGGYGGGGYGGYFGGSGFGFGGSPRGNQYGPGSYSPYGAGSMGYGGGRGMRDPYGGRMGYSGMGGYGPGNFGNFGQGYNQMAQQLMGGPGGGYGGGYGGGGGGGYQPYQPLPFYQPPPPPERIWGGGSQDDGGRSCFVAGTTVTLANGGVKNIEDVKIGDFLMGEGKAANEVIEFDHPLLGDRALYALNGGKYFVTSEHPFATPGGWKSINPAATADENPDLDVGVLILGDKVIRITGDALELTKISSKAADADTQLYNFKLGGNNTYYANGYLVHNKQGDGPGGGPSGGNNGGGDGSGCFAEGTLFEMADGTFKPVEQIEVNDKMRGGIVLRTRSGPSTNRWYEYQGTDVTDEHFVFEDGVWKYVKDASGAFEIPSHAMYYTLDNVEHRLYGVNGVEFTDDAVFDDDHWTQSLPYEKATWDLMLVELNERDRRAA